jgi:hypothetical protein
MEIREPKPPGTLWATPGLLRDYFTFIYICSDTVHNMGQDSSVGIATRYGLEGPVIESRWGDILRARPDRPWGTPSLPYNGYPVFPGGKAAGAWR